ncbi:hypothetical protein [Marinobacter daepoensis]|uniref:Uncharacterized protein n=1 Tax=Marinobacter daepoensis TaxID=262077 RepID=A0ABS3BI41_9GAMM|nr:hypothetical protein [Marinobacter daepoensis]MBN7771488.1 hypothetical protein [Marinobacter daepoensis]
MDNNRIACCEIPVQIGTIEKTLDRLRGRHDSNNWFSHKAFKKARFGGYLVAGLFAKEAEGGGQWLCLDIKIKGVGANSLTRQIEQADQ